MKCRHQGPAYLGMKLKLVRSSALNRVNDYCSLVLLLTSTSFVAQGGICMCCLLTGRLSGHRDELSNLILDFTRYLYIYVQ